MADVSASILKQVEYYFSDFNLPKDKFLQGELASNDGWARIATLGSFVRLQQLSKDVEVIAAALRTSESLLEVSEDGLKVRRKTDLPADLDLDATTVYIKGFDQALTLDEVMAILAEKNVNAQSVRLRTYKDADGGKKFRGSVFVSFSTPEAAQLVVTTGIEGYTVKSKTDYENEGKSGSTAANAKFPANAVFVSDVLVKIENLRSSEIRRELLKEWAEKINSKVAYVEFSIGDNKATLRLAEDAEVKAAEFVEKINTIMEEIQSINNGEAPVFIALSGDDEKAAWEAIEQAKQEKRDNFGKKNAGHGFKRAGNNKRTKRN